MKKAISVRRLAKCQNTHYMDGAREMPATITSTVSLLHAAPFKVMPFVPITWFHYIFYNPLIFVVLATFVCFDIFFYWLNLSYYIVMMINFTHYIQLWCTFDRSSTLMLTLALSHRNNAPSYERDSRAETQRASKSAYFVGQCFCKWKCLKYFTELISSTHNWS